MNYTSLRALIETHPTHGATSDADMQSWLEDPAEVTRNRESMTTDELVQVTLSFPADYAALSGDKREALLLIASGMADFSLVNNTPIREALEIIFATTDIFTELASRLTEDVSRLTDAGLGAASLDHIAHARTFGG